MKYLKSYNESVVNPGIELRDSIIRFLISRENQYQKTGDYSLTFDTYQLVSVDGGTKIKAITRSDRKGNEPYVPYVMYDFDVYVNWLSELKRSDPLNVRKKMMESVMSYLDSGQEPDETVCKVLDGILSCENSWGKTVDVCNRLKEVFFPNMTWMRLT